MTPWGTSRRHPLDAFRITEEMCETQHKAGVFSPSDMYTKERTFSDVIPTIVLFRYVCRSTLYPASADRFRLVPFGTRVKWAFSLYGFP